VGGARSCEKERYRLSPEPAMAASSHSSTFDKNVTWIVVESTNSTIAGALMHVPDTTKNLVIHDDIHMTFSDFVIDHTASMTNCQISS
jgi:hypothetical protein